MKFIVSLFLFIVLMAIIGSGSDKKQVPGQAQQQAQFQPKPSFMDDVNQKVISDAEEEYQIANRSGNATDRCVHAGISGGRIHPSARSVWLSKMEDAAR